MTPLLWAMVLLTFAIAIIFLEMFVPSGGLLSLMSGVAAFAAVFVVFYFEGFLHGALFLLATTVTIPIAVAAAIRWWPHTSIGHKVLNLPPGEEDEITSPPSYDGLRELIGQRGLALSKMLPSGSISLAGRSFDAVSQSGFIDAGQPVQVVKVDGTRIMVRRLAANATPADADEAGSSQAGRSEATSEPVIPDPFEEPFI